MQPNYLEIIRQRRSVRTFDGAAFREEDRQKILSFAEKIENPYDVSVQWRILDAKKYGLSSPVIFGTDTYISGKLRQEPHAEEAFGYTLEAILLYAQTLGLGATWIAGTMNRPAFEAAMEPGKDEVMPCVSPLGVPAEKMSFRESMMRKGVKADERLPFGELFFYGDFDTPMRETDGEKITEALRAVRLAPSAVNKQPWRVLLAGHTAYFYEKPDRGYVSANGWDLQKVDLGIALCHFVLAAKEVGLTLEFSTVDPGFAAPGSWQFIAAFRYEN